MCVNSNTKYRLMSTYEGTKLPCDYLKINEQSMYVLTLCSVYGRW